MQTAGGCKQVEVGRRGGALPVLHCQSLAFAITQKLAPCTRRHAIIVFLCQLLDDIAAHVNFGIVLGSTVSSSVNSSVPAK